ncbi:hypothetical protein JCM8547_008274 [Rhodosporidiobolus lusitaniae]
MVPQRPPQPLEPVASTSSVQPFDEGRISNLDDEGEIGEVALSYHEQHGEGQGEGGTVRQRTGPAGRRRKKSDAPSYAQSEFVEIVRRQRVRSSSNALKLPRHLLVPVRSRSSSGLPDSSSPHPAGDPSYPPALPFDKAPPALPHEWDFAGWGSMSYLELDGGEVDQAKERRREEMKRDGEGVLGPWMASGVAGVAVAGSPLYAFPALVAVAGIYSPISLLIATLLLSFWQPIMTELAAALPISGANYAYLLNSSPSLSFALLGASLTLLDDVATSVVAAATAASYIADQGVKAVGAEMWLTIVLICGIAVVGLVGVKGSAGVTLMTLGIHLTVLSILFVSSLVHWVRHGNSTLSTNWHASLAPSASSTAKALFQGICIAFLGVTGIESTPDYVSTLRLVSAIALLHRMSLDGYLPPFLLKPLRYTGVPALVVALFTSLCIIVFTSSGNSLSVVSNMFALVFLSIMTLYPLSLLILLHNRPSLPRPVSRPTPFLLTLVTLLLSLTLVAGVIWTSPINVALFAAYGAAIWAAVLGCARKGRVGRLGWWVCQEGVGWNRGAEWCVGMMKKAKEGRDVVLFVKGDEINTLFERISYVERNEETARVKLVHFYGNARTASPATASGNAGASKSKEELDVEGAGGDATLGTDVSGVDDIPSELEANFRILDEAFPSITIDLVFLQAPFSPPYIHALAYRLRIPVARCFMGSPSSRWMNEREWGMRELAGVRVISD